MHPAESLKFTDGELSNVMRSDFCQRDREIKQPGDESVGKNDAEKR